MRIITIGTGAGRPTLRRFSSATGLEYRGDTFLFDCGEGTQIRLMKAPLRWGRFQAIFISHLHGDHINGLPGLLGSLSLSDRHEKMTLFGPKGLKKLLGVLQEFQRMDLRYPLDLVEIKKPGILFETQFYQVEGYPLEHSVECWGYVFREKERPGRFNGQKAARCGIPSGPLRAQLVRGESITMEDGRVFHSKDFVGPPRPGRSVAFCLDTRPSERVVSMAKGVDILLYEATFSEEFREEANRWGHSTAADGARIAKKANVGRLILTHVSQRYSDESILLEEARSIFPRVTIASDLEVFEVERREE